jgi:WhiB family redox-sensing transcriptional regulator
MDWRHRGACIGIDPELFFPTGTGAAADRQAAEAKAVCVLCPVREDCLAWALRKGEQGGIWGGLDQDERRSAARARVRPIGAPDGIECKGCHKVLPPDRFARDLKGKDGRKGKCCKCVYNRKVERRQEREGQEALPVG